MIKLINLKKNFGKGWVTNGVNLTIPKGKMTLIVGRSGAGKSVLLKQLAGLILPTEGQILVEEKDITILSDQQLRKKLKKFGYVFQFAALLDSLTIFENIGITLLEKGYSREETLSIVKEKLKEVYLPEKVLYSYPSELSGGMCKRVGLARTLITNPEVILYDEPTTGLDPITTDAINQLMFKMQKKLGVTSVVVTHDLGLFKYADNVALLYDGKIQYVGDAKKVWESANPYIYQFMRGLSDGPMQAER